MSKKRKINYAELLKGTEPATPPAAVPAAASTTTPPEGPTPGTPSPGAPEKPAPAPRIEPEVVPTPPERDPAPGAPPVRDPSPDPSTPTPRPVEVPDEPTPPSRARTPRRRAADRAASPLGLAAALNEREAFERRERGETPVPAPQPMAPEPIGADAITTKGAADAAIAPDAGGPPRNHDGGADAAGHHPADATGSASPPPRETSALVALSGDTMEFAVTSAVQALPFRERARARLGRAELLLFRVGRELFATPLAAVEEAVELAEIRPIPEMSASMLGVTELRGRMIPIYSPSRSLGVDLGAAPAAALIVRSGERRMALAVDDVEDVLEADLADLRDAPGVDDADGVLAGVVRRGATLVSVLDGESLVAACLTDPVPETA